MKKIILACLFILGIFGGWWISSHSKKPQVNNTLEKSVPSPEEILASDYEKIAKNLKAVNISGNEWKQINDYSQPVEKIVKDRESASSFFKTAKLNLPDIYSCLKKDFCGMTTRNDNDAYFDDQATPAHILINRNLKIMKGSLKKDQSLKSQVDWELMQELASSDSELLSVEALDIIREFDAESIKTDGLIKLSSDYTGVAKADALVRISKNNGPADKLLLANEIEEVFAGSNNNTVISVLEKVKQMSFSKEELPRVLRNLCRYHNNADEERNWLMIKFHAKKLYPDFEKLCN